MDQADKDLVASEQIAYLLRLMKVNKPNDRSPKDLHYAVAITEMEKVFAYFQIFVVEETELGG